MRSPGWADLYAWQVDRASRTPLFQQIYLQIRAAIVSRTLAPGLRLPSTRGLASRLRVARTSVILAYEQLLAEGYIAGRARSGTFISPDLPAPIESRPRQRIDRPGAKAVSLASRGKALERLPAAGAVETDATPFNMGRTRVDARTVTIWRRLTQQVMRSLGPVHLGYSDPQGLSDLRNTISDYLRAARAVQCEPGQIIVTGGTQAAVDLAVRVLLDRDDQVWVEDPCYPVTYDALATAAMRICPIPVDAYGLNVGLGVRTAPRARAVFVTSSHQFP
jgi:GntR family transcriptional regulator / MocR family aminotransferase